MRPVAPTSVRQESFSAGEVDPAFHGQFSEGFYDKAAATIRNHIVTKKGTLVNRPGTKFIAATKDSGTKKSRLFTFCYSDDQAYGVEVGDKYVRVRDATGAAKNMVVSQFAAVSSSTLKYSPDGGQTWATAAGATGTASTMASNASGSVLVSACVSGNQILYSKDYGRSWTAKALAGAWYGVTWTGSYWLVVGASGKIAKSDTADPAGAWTTQAIGAGTWYNVATDGAGSALAVGTAGYTLSGNHGVTWGAATAIAGMSSADGVAWGNSRWAVVGFDASNYLMVVTSPLAISWTTRYTSTIPVTEPNVEIVYTGTAFVSGTKTAAGYVIRSATGDAWGIVAALGAKILTVATAPGTVVVGANSKVFVSYDDGLTFPYGFDFAASASCGWSGVAEATFPYAEADLPKVRESQIGDTQTYVRIGKSMQDLLRRSDGDFETRYVGPETVSAPDGLAFPGTLNQIGDADHPIKEWQWKVTWQAEGGRESLPSAALTPPTSGKVCLYPDRPVTIQWNGVAGAARYHVYRGRNGQFGYVGTTKATGAATETFYDDGSTPVISNDPPQWTNPFSSETPGASVVFQDRRVYGNTASNPSKLWFSAVGDHFDFDESFVKNADDAFMRTLATLKFEEIRALVWLGDLLVFTSEAAWALNGAQGSIAFDNVAGDPEVYEGCAWIQPQVVGKECMFVQARGNQIRNLYRSADGWDSDEISYFVEHLFKGRTVVSWAYAKRPNSTFWIVLDDGSLVSLTYVKGKMWAFAKHDTAGDQFEDVTTVPEGGFDVPWFIVKRTVNGSTVRHIEKMQDRFAITASADFCGLDDAVYYTGAAVSTVTGLTHLIGREVYGLANGTVRGPVTVNGSGEAVFGGATSTKWWVGLAITYQFASLDYKGYHTAQKTVQRVAIDTSLESLPVDPSVRLSVGTDLSNLNSAYEVANARQGVLDSIVSTRQNPGGRVAIQYTAPVPIEIKGITREIVVGQ